MRLKYDVHVPLGEDLLCLGAYPAEFPSSYPDTSDSGIAQTLILAPTLRVFLSTRKVTCTLKFCNAASHFCGKELNIVSSGVGSLFVRERSD